MPIPVGHFLPLRSISCFAGTISFAPPSRPGPRFLRCGAARRARPRDEAVRPSRTMLWNHRSAVSRTRCSLSPLFAASTVSVALFADFFQHRVLALREQARDIGFVGIAGFARFDRRAMRSGSVRRLSFLVAFFCRWRRILEHRIDVTQFPFSSLRKKQLRGRCGKRCRRLLHLEQVASASSPGAARAASARGRIPRPWATAAARRDQYTASRASRSRRAPHGSSRRL